MPAKLVTYLNLARKSGSIIFGLDNIKKSKKIECVVASCDATDKMKNKIIELSQARNVSYRFLQGITLDSLINTTNCKVIGIINKNLVEPILISEE